MSFEFWVFSLVVVFNLGNRPTKGAKQVKKAGWAWPNLP